MISWEEIKAKISDANDKIVNKTRDFAESVRIKGALNDMEKDRDKLFAELGRLFYEDRYSRTRAKTLEKKLAELPDGDLKKDIVAKVLELRQNEEAVTELEEALKKLQGITKCPVCGADVTPDSGFCIECGTRILREADEEAQEADAPSEEEGEEDAEAAADVSEAAEEENDAEAAEATDEETENEEN